ncbi:sensor histidine kinase [Brevundimonas sp.]|uniref:sensor histidine kinase n=1 Tax=Brevundimonas sp. TaxID=1871086 RepID=UPI002AC8BA57|nr:CHASE3 domain-containing protein [Brevundimonas sp.]
MISKIRQGLAAIGRFMRVPTLGRTVVGMLTLALALLLIVNAATFVMILRTADFNDEVERGNEIRATSKDVLTRLVDAETGQRGFLLIGRGDYLTIHGEAIRELPVLFEELERLAAGDAVLTRHVARIREFSEQRLVVMERSIALAQAGRGAEAVDVVRGGQGKAAMDAMRAEIAVIDQIVMERLAVRTQQSELAANLTMAINALAGALVLLLAAISVWLVRRYIADVQAASYELDRVNAGLEEEVRNRTAALMRANEEIQRFAYIVSHDLRAPLVNVMGYTSELEQAGKIIDRQISRLETLAPDLIESDAVTAVREDVPEAVGFIRASTEKMDRLINAILKLSREGRRNLAPETLDMTAMVGRIADSVRHQTEAADAEIVVQPLPTIESDRLSIEQILGNLIDNAVKYLEPSRPGRIVVEGHDAPGGWVVYRVIDNGRGISERDHERIFELFRRSGRQDRTGEGVGLAFVRNSVRRLGGSIDVESELGKGSTFHLKFPKRLILSEVGDAT